MSGIREFLDLDDDGSMFLRNVGCQLPCYWEWRKITRESSTARSWNLNLAHSLTSNCKHYCCNKNLDTVIVSGWKSPQNFGSWIFRPSWDFYRETTENDCHNEHSGHKLSSESCKRVESISATKYKQKIREAYNDKKSVTCLEVQIVIYTSKMFRPTIFFLSAVLPDNRRTNLRPRARGTSYPLSRMVCAVISSAGKTIRVRKYSRIPHWRDFATCLIMECAEHGKSQKFNCLITKQIHAVLLTDMPLCFVKQIMQ
jgi:hypothetical protein